MYKINHKDQFILTKLGKIIKPEDDLQKLFEKNTENAMEDKTFSKSFNKS